MLSALLAPVSMLAQDVRTGKLGGICSVNTTLASSSASSPDDAPQAASHCELCGVLGLALLPPAVSAIPSFAGSQLAAADFPAAASAAIPGLPFSRGPPAL